MLTETLYLNPNFFNQTTICHMQPQVEFTMLSENRSLLSNVYLTALGQGDKGKYALVNYHFVQNLQVLTSCQPNGAPRTTPVATILHDQLFSVHNRAGKSSLQETQH